MASVALITACHARATRIEREVVAAARTHGASLRDPHCERVERTDGAWCTATVAPADVAALINAFGLRVDDALARVAIASEPGGCSDRPGFHAPASIEAFTAAGPGDGPARVRLMLYASERHAVCFDVGPR